MNRERQPTPPADTTGRVFQRAVRWGRQGPLVLWKVRRTPPFPRGHLAPRGTPRGPYAPVRGVPQADQDVYLLTDLGGKVRKIFGKEANALAHLRESSLLPKRWLVLWNEGYGGDPSWGRDPMGHWADMTTPPGYHCSVARVGNPKPHSWVPYVVAAGGICDSKEEAEAVRARYINDAQIHGAWQQQASGPTATHQRSAASSATGRLTPVVVDVARLYDEIIDRQLAARTGKGWWEGNKRTDPWEGRVYRYVWETQAKADEDMESWAKAVAGNHDLPFRRPGHGLQLSVCFGATMVGPGSPARWVPLEGDLSNPNGPPLPAAAVSACPLAGYVDQP